MSELEKQEESANAAFCKDIPEGQQEKVYDDMSEAIHGAFVGDYISVVDSERSEMGLNAHGSGIVSFNGEEYYFVMQCGISNGTVLEEWTIVDGPLTSGLKAKP